MNRRQYVVDLITAIVKGSDQAQAVQTSELIVERLTEEGVLHLGYGDADVDLVVDTFTECFGTTKVTKPDRFAANRLVKKYGAQSVAGIIRLLAEKRDEKYAPVVGNVYELENKWVSVMNFLRNNNPDTIQV